METPASTFRVAKVSKKSVVRSITDFLAVADDLRPQAGDHFILVESLERITALQVDEDLAVARWQFSTGPTEEVI
jgi:hypothetical protein